MEVYNKNRDKNNSMHDEIREQNAKLKDAPLKEKLAYFREYYLKTTIIAVICILFVGHIIYTMATGRSDTAFAAYFYNDTGDPSSTELLDGFVGYMGIDTKKHNAYIDASINYSIDAGDGSSYDSYMDLQKAMAVIATQELDVIIGEAETIDHFANGECFYDITTILPADLLAQFSDKLYLTTSGEGTDPIPVGIYVTDAPKLARYGYYVDREPVFSILINSGNVDTAIAFLRYIYME